MDSNKVMHRRRPEAPSMLRPGTSTKERKAHRVSDTSLLMVTGCLIRSDPEWIQGRVT